MSKRFSEEENKLWRESLPKKSIASKLIVKSNSNRILLVKPDYKDTWQLPGGSVDANEDPRITAARESKEEANIDINVDDIKIVGSIFRANEDNLILIYECTVKVNEQGDYSVTDEEIEEYRFLSPQEVAKLLPSYYKEFWSEYIKYTESAEISK